MTSMSPGAARTHTKSVPMQAAAVVAAAVAYVDSAEPTETKDLYFSLESAVMAFLAAVQALNVSEPPGTY